MNTAFDRDSIVHVLNGMNPWWHGLGPDVPAFHRTAFDECLGLVRHEILRRAVMVTGPRRVGKSTVLLQVAKRLVQDGAEPKSVLHLTLDHPLLRQVRFDQILDAYRGAVYTESKRTFLLIDEVHYAADWDLHVKTLVDHFHHQYRIIATGSSSLEHRHRPVHSGVGRWVGVAMPPLSFYEFLHLRGEAPDGVDPGLRPESLFTLTPFDLGVLGARLRPAAPLFERYMLVGGFPETANNPDLARCQRMLQDDVIGKVLRQDMLALFAVRSVAELESLFVYLCLHNGGIVNVATCASQMGVTRATVSNYLDLLMQAQLLHRVEPYALSGKRVLKARHKYYLVDGALRSAMLLSGEEVLRDPVQAGVLAENTVLRHLLPGSTSGLLRLSYWRDAQSGKEVDFVCSTPRRSEPVEVKWRDRAPVEDDGGLAAFCKDQKPERAYLVTRSEADFGLTKVKNAPTAVLKVPAHVFCYLAGQAERGPTPARARQ